MMTQSQGYSWLLKFAWSLPHAHIPGAQHVCVLQALRRLHALAATCG